MIHLVDNVTSTNIWLNHFNKDYFDSVLSLKQSRGYGRVGRVWESDIGGLYYSLVLPYRNIMSIVIGVSVADILVKNKVNVKLKWPNDILVNGKKLGGIICQSQDGKTIVGLGINIDNKPVLATAISLSDLGCNMDKLYFINELTKKIKISMDYSDIDIINKFLHYDCLIGKEVSWQEGNGRVETISRDGSLVVRDKDNQSISLTDEVHLE